MDRERISLPRTFELQEFLALKEGIKPVMRGGLTSSDNETVSSLNDFCEEYGFHLLIKSFTQIHGEKLDNIIYISRSKELTKQAYEAEKNIDVKRLGELLGYPECCTNFYYDVIKECECGRIKQNLKFSYILQSFLRTRGKPFFHTNNIFNVQSRMGITIPVRRLLKPLVNCFLISHIPCSYRCRKSVKLGRDVLRVLEREIPGFANKVTLALKRPFLFFDDFRWVAFDGSVKGNKIVYDGIAPYKSFYVPSKFENADTVKVDDEEILISREGELVHKIKKKNKDDGIIIDFS